MAVAPSFLGQFVDCIVVMAATSLFCLLFVSAMLARTLEGDNVEPPLPEFQELAFEAHLGDHLASAAIRRICGSSRDREYSFCHSSWSEYASINRSCTTHHCRLLARYAAVHAQATVNITKARLLICQPFFGQGNRVNAVLSCLAMALSTDRVLLIDWHGQATDVDDGGADVAAAGGELADLMHSTRLSWDINATHAAQLLAAAAAAGDLLTGAAPPSRAGAPPAVWVGRGGPKHQ